jgi:hypothetical protein
LKEFFSRLFRQTISHIRKSLFSSNKTFHSSHQGQIPT